jgi:hypothetical protein
MYKVAVLHTKGDVEVGVTVPVLPFLPGNEAEGLVWGQRFFLHVPEKTQARTDGRLHYREGLLHVVPHPDQYLPGRKAE